MYCIEHFSGFQGVPIWGKWDREPYNFLDALIFLVGTLLPN